MDQRPEQPPEGRLIADAAGRLDLSIREAARRAGLSYGRWRQVTQGYQNVSPGNFARVRAPAKTLARMAAVAGVTPEQMETEGQRPDAAEIMRDRATADTAAAADTLTVVRSDAPAPPVSLERGPGDLFPDIDPAIRPGVDRHVEDIRELVESARKTGPLTGNRIFPGDPHEADRWDWLAELSLSLWQLIRLMAVGRVRDDERRAGQQPRQIRGV